VRGGEGMQVAGMHEGCKEAKRERERD
jgi:hypothetical protein